MCLPASPVSSNVDMIPVGHSLRCCRGQLSTPQLRHIAAIMRSIERGSSKGSPSKSKTPRVPGPVSVTRVVGTPSLRGNPAHIPTHNKTGIAAAAFIAAFAEESAHPATRRMDDCVRTSTFPPTAVRLHASFERCVQTTTLGDQAQRSSL